MIIKILKINKSPRAVIFLPFCSKCYIISIRKAVYICTKDFILQKTLCENTLYKAQIWTYTANVSPMDDTIDFSESYLTDKL